jgi:hypothetical protein
MAVPRFVHLHFPSNEDGSLTHRMRNLGEALWQAIEKTGLGTLGGLNAVDMTTNLIVVEVHHASKVRTVEARVRRLLAEHKLDSQCVMTLMASR